MGVIFKVLGDNILKLLPANGYRTYIIAGLQLVYALAGVVTGHLTPEQAGIHGASAIGLLTAAKHQG